MPLGSHVTLDIFADAVLDLHVEGGVFRLTLAQATPQATAEGSAAFTLTPKASLFLTERGFDSLCEVVDAARQQMLARSAADHQAGSSPNFS